MTKIIQKNFKIEGMHCSSCAMNIDFDLEDVEGVLKANTSYAKMVSKVEFDKEKIEEEEIIDQIAKTGYKAVAE